MSTKRTTKASERNLEAVLDALDRWGATQWQRACFNLYVNANPDMETPLVVRRFVRFVQARAALLIILETAADGDVTRVKKIERLMNRSRAPRYQSGRTNSREDDYLMGSVFGLREGRLPRPTIKLVR